MKRMNRKSPDWILPNIEESKLSVEDEQIYIKKLREFCSVRKLCTTILGALTVASRLKK